MTIYSLPTCKPCITAKYLLNQKGIKYTEKNLHENIDELRSMGFMAAPVFKVGDVYTSEVSRAIELHHEASVNVS